MPRDWDAYFSDPANIDLIPAPLLVEAADLLPPGDALDLACGPGRHALYLARLGWKVTAVDSSAAAIGFLQSQAAGLPIQTVRADLERGEFTIGHDAYDLICDYLYLQRDLFPQIREGIRMGGAFVGAIRLTGNFHLAPGELRELFAGWKIFYYSETDIAQIVARKA